MNVTRNRLEKLSAILDYVENELSALGEDDMKEIHDLTFSDIDFWKSWAESQIEQRGAKG